MEEGTEFEPFEYAMVSNLRKVDEVTDKLEIAVIEAQWREVEEMDFVM